MFSRNRYHTSTPFRPAKGALILGIILFSSGILVPITPKFQARAESVWTSKPFDDFNATGASFTNCEIRGAGNDTGIVLKTAPDWVEKSAPKSPPARSFGGMAAINTDDKAVLFGGTALSSDMSDTWVYDLSDRKWTDMTPAESPTARDTCQLATVFGDDKVVLFGGWHQYPNGSSIMLNDTWVYDLGDNTWTNRTPAVSPPPSNGFSMATVNGTDMIVLFTGVIGNIYNSYYPRETWIYDISENTWTLRHFATSLSERYGQAMAAVWNDDSVVLFGGYNYTNDHANYLSDTWVYVLGDDQWYQRSPATKPPGRFYSALATRYFDDKIILFGGATSGSYMNDTWLYDLSDDIWALQSPCNKPSERIRPGMATVAGTDKTVVFGGEYSNIFDGTWVWEPDAHYRTGEYISPLKSVGGPACFLSINWTATVPANTALKFQVRTADTKFNLTRRNFTGPAGTNTSYYQGDSELWSTMSGDSWVQYCAFLSTLNAAATPELHVVDITYDLFPGTPELLGPPNGAWINTSSPVFNWRFNDTDSDEQGMFDWQLDRNENFTTHDYRSGMVGSNETAYMHDKPLPEGQWLWHVRTADGHDWGPFSEIRTVGVDISPPSPFTPHVQPAMWTSGAIDLSFLTDDNVSGIQNNTVFIDNEPYGTHESPWTLPKLPDGTHTIVVHAYDMAGNWAEGRTKAFTDRTAPADFTPVSEPASWTGSSPQITFSTKDNASGVDHYEVRVDQGPFMVHSSPYTPPKLDNGEHELTVRAVDRAGNFVEGSVKIYIDWSKPDPLAIDVAPPGWTNSDQTITYSTQDTTSDIERYEVSIDGGPFAVRTSPLNLTGLTDGEHTVTVRAYDQGGNLIEGEARAFTDRSAPNPFTIAANPADWARKAPTLTFSTSDNITAALTYKASIDHSTFSMVKSPWTPSAIGDGAHLIVIRASDEAGNSVEANVTMFIDKSPPDKVVLAINNGSPSTQSRKVRLTITATDAGSGPGRMCFSDDGVSYSQWEPFTSQKNWTLIPGSGGKAIYVKVQDALGNEARPASATINYTGPAKLDAWIPIAIGAVGIVIVAAIAVFAALWLRKRKMRG